MTSASAGRRRHLTRFLVTESTLNGLGLGLVFIPASAAFVTDFGADRLPYVYLVVAVVGVIGSAGISGLLDRYSLARTASSVEATIAAAILAAWLILAGGVDVASAALLVLFSVQLAFGFVLVGSQAGQVLDVDDIKVVMPRVTAGFVAGFMISGIIASIAGRIVDDPLPLLGGAVASFALLAVLLGVVTRRYVRPQTAEAQTEDTGPAPSVLRHPLVLGLLGYQMLSAVGTQLVDYVLFAVAERRYDEVAELASFVGDFTFALNLVDLAALLFVGGLLMSRYGVRFGLAANPAVVTVLAVVAFVLAFGDVDSTALLVLIAAARITDLTAADLATRTAVNAAYQALPTRERVRAQVVVEGVGVPLSFGVVGLALIALNALPGESIRWAIGLTVIVCALWSAASRFVLDRYRSSVAALLRLTDVPGLHDHLADPEALPTLRRLALTGSAAQALPALRILHDHGDTELDRLLIEISDRPDRQVVLGALDVMVERHHPDAGRVAARLVDDDDPSVCARALGLTGRLGPPDQTIAEMSRSRSASPDPQVRAAALAGVLRHPSSHPSEVVDKAAERWVADVASEVVDDRVAAAVVLGGWRLGVGFDQAAADVAVGLAADPIAVVRAALGESFGALPDDETAAVLALAEDDDRALITVLAALGEVGPATTPVILRMADESVPSRRTSIAQALSRADGIDGEDVEPALRAALDRLVTARRAAHDVESLDGAGSMASALRSTLGEVVEETTSEVAHLLQAAHGADLANAFREAADPATTTPAATESLDTTLAGRTRRLVLDAVGPVATEPTTWESALARLVVDTSWAPAPDWLTAVALATADELGVAVPSIEPPGPLSAEVLHAPTV